MSNCCTYKLIRKEPKEEILSPVNSNCFATIRQYYDDDAGKGLELFVFLNKDVITKTTGLDWNGVLKYLTLLKNSKIFVINEIAETSELFENSYHVSVPMGEHTPPRIMGTLMALRYLFEGVKVTKPYEALKEDKFGSIPPMLLDIMEALPFLDASEAIQMAQYSVKSYVNYNHTLVATVGVNKVVDWEDTLKRSKIKGRYSWDISSCFTGEVIVAGCYRNPAEYIKMQEAYLDKKLFLEFYNHLGGKKELKNE